MAQGCLMHSYSVAVRCEELAEARGCKDARKYYKLGFLHDSGGVSNTGKAGGFCERELACCGYPSWHPIRSGFKTFALDILNRAELETMPDGRRCSAAQRLDDIAGRYGRDSEEYSFKSAIARELNLI